MCVNPCLHRPAAIMCSNSMLELASQLVGGKSSLLSQAPLTSMDLIYLLQVATDCYQEWMAVAVDQDI